jgi:hypothetical protein
MLIVMRTANDIRVPLTGAATWKTRLESVNLWIVSKNIVVGLGAK